MNNITKPCVSTLPVQKLPGCPFDENELMGKMDIHELAIEFYAIEALHAIVLNGNGFEPFRHSHDRWYRDFTEFRARFNNKLARAIFDYTVIVVAGEMRHAENHASSHIADYCDMEMKRETVYEKCTVYAPDSILSAGLKLFHYSINWSKRYGGYPWYLIAKAGSYYNALPDSVFIDHCVDLSHNSAPYFDKGAKIFRVAVGHLDYAAFLNFKSTCKPELLLNDLSGKYIRQLLCRAANLGIVDGDANSYTYFASDDEDRLLEYVPIEWGGDTLPCNLIKSPNYEEYSSHTGYKNRLWVAA